MMMVLLVCLLLGAVLGQRFKVLILLPAMLPTVTFATIVVALQGATVWQIVATAFLAGTSLQIGYLAGIGIRHLTIVERASRLGAHRLAVSTSPRTARQLADKNHEAASV